MTEGGRTMSKRNQRHHEAPAPDVAATEHAADPAEHHGDGHAERHGDGHAERHGDGHAGEHAREDARQHAMAARQKAMRTQMPVGQSNMMRLKKGNQPRHGG
jgi:hypothetical protein